MNLLIFLAVLVGPILFTIIILYLVPDVGAFLLSKEWYNKAFPSRSRAISKELSSDRTCGSAPPLDPPTPPPYPGGAWDFMREHGRCLTGTEVTAMDLKTNQEIVRINAFINNVETISPRLISPEIRNCALRINKQF